MSTIKCLTSAFVVVMGLTLTEDLRADSPSVMPIQREQQILSTPDYTGSFLERSTISGDWGGTRQELANNGLTLDANLTQVEQGVTAGGIEDGWEYMGRGEVTLNADTTKMGLWPGGLLTVMGEGNYGDSLTNRNGSLIGVNMNEILPQVENSFVIPQVTFTQFLSPQFGIVVGKIATISENGGDKNEFAHGKGNDQFLNLAFNINPVSALTVPYSTLGVGAIYIPSADFIGSLSVLDPHGSPESAGFDDLFEDGATFAAEGRYTTRFFGKTGHQLLGATYSSSNYTDLDQRVSNLIIPGLPTEEADGSWAVYWNADQYFYQPEPGVNRGIGFFARFGLSDGEANPIENFSSAGIGGKGVIPCRENDGFGIGYFYTKIADTQVTSRLNFGDSQGAEAYYEAALTPSIRLSPDIQWIQPSADRVDSSWNFGVRLHTIF